MTFYGIVTHSVADNDNPKLAWYSPTDWIITALGDEINVDVDWFCVNAGCS